MSESRDTHQRLKLIAEIAADVRSLRLHLGKDELAPAVLGAIADVPRDRFVLAEDRARAWENTALDIACGQRISQPLVVAVMTDMLNLTLSDRVLEIGTGCGYQAAVVSELSADVYSVEVLEPLARDAAVRLGQLGFDNVHVRHGDGMLGWPEASPFDAVIFTAATPAIPDAIFEQLKPGGRAIAPIGETSSGPWDDMSGQTLVLFEKDDDGCIERTPLFGVRFIPIIDGRRMRRRKQTP